MIIVAGFLMGALTGAAIARKRGGKGLDLMHYATGYGIAFALLGTFVTILLSRTLV